MDLKNRLETRWFLKQRSHDELFEKFWKGWQTLYVGFDPTADSLHLWNFVQFMHALQYMLYWNKVILLLWWATWMVWDPWGKDSERNFLDDETLLHNVESIRKQVGTIIEHISSTTGKKFDYEVVNNADFYEWISYIDFLRDIGKHMTVNQMMHRETVKHRLTEEGKFISYTEFSYMLMQWFDYLYLFKNKQCSLQIWASDQRWNLITWVELIRKKEQGESFAATCPLLTDSTWRKFWKSEWNAIWLDVNKNSPYVCYNYFMNSWDEDIKKYLLTFTLLSVEEIDVIIQEHQQEPHLRKWHSVLAYEVTKIAFWEQQASLCVQIKETLYGGSVVESIQSLSSKWVIALNKATSWITTTKSARSLIELLVETWLYSSNWEAKKAIKANAISLNENKITDIGHTLSDDDYINWLVVLRKWKKNYATVLLNK